jgi:hypothetical protein
MLYAVPSSHRSACRSKDTALALTGPSLRVIDANHHLVGHVTYALLDTFDTHLTVFDPALNVFMSVELIASAVSSLFQGDLYFTTTDCTGQPWFVGINPQLLVAANGYNANQFYLPDATQGPQLITTQSRYVPNRAQCLVESDQQTFMPLTPVTLPYVPPFSLVTD